MSKDKKKVPDIGVIKALMSVKGQDAVQVATGKHITKAETFVRKKGGEITFGLPKDVTHKIMSGESLVLLYILDKQQVIDKHEEMSMEDSNG